VRFLEYAYRRNYTVPSWTCDERAKAASDKEEARLRQMMESRSASLAPPTPPLPIEEPEGLLDEPTGAVEDTWGFAASASIPIKKIKKKKVRPEEPSLRVKFGRRNYLTDQSPDITLYDKCQPTRNTDVNPDYTPVFLAHARLYTFANMRLIDPLKELALEKLHRTLVSFRLYPERVGDVVELVRYAYDNGPDRTEQGVLNDLRQLVTDYVVVEVETVGTNAEFKALLEEGGEFVGDFWGLVSKNWS
jgi:hypothetical protein